MARNLRWNIYCNVIPNGFWVYYLTHNWINFTTELWICRVVLSIHIIFHLLLCFPLLYVPCELGVCRLHKDYFPKYVWLYVHIYTMSALTPPPPNTRSSSIHFKTQMLSMRILSRRSLCDVSQQRNVIVYVCFCFGFVVVVDVYSLVGWHVFAPRVCGGAKWFCRHLCGVCGYSIGGRDVTL